MIRTVKGFSIVNEAEVDVFLEFSCFFYDPTDVGNLIFGSSACSSASLVSLMLLIPSRVLFISVCLFFSSYSSLVNISFIFSTVLSRSQIIFTEEVKWSCSVVSDSLQPMDCSLPGSSVHRILQARILEWVAISFPQKYFFEPPIFLRGGGGQEYWSGLLFPSPGELPDPIIEPGSPPL